MDKNQKVLMVDASTGFYRTDRYEIGKFFGPVDLGLHLSGKYKSLNIGVGLLAGSIFPGSNRLVVSGYTENWHGFYVSSMGGAGLVFNDLGVNMVSIVGKAPTPSILYLNRIHNEEIQVKLEPIDARKVWNEGRKGIYSVIDQVYDKYKEDYENSPRVLAVGPSAESTDFAGIGSVPIRRGVVTHTDTWAGRGGFGSKMFQEHGLVAIIYGGTHIDEDFRDRKVADSWFEEKYNKRLAAKDMESTMKYRFDPKFNTGGTFGVNFATLKGRTMAFNYKSIYMTEEERLDLHQRLILDHYLKQFNEETIIPKKQKTCGEPCSAVCKKYRDKYKKDYEPYQTMGPLSGIFDQRAAEKLNNYADASGFDAISVGGVISWLMECLDEGIFTPEELGVSSKPKFSVDEIKEIEKDSMHNADLGIEILDSIIQKRGLLDFSSGARKFARRMARLKGREVIDKFVYSAFARKGWMVPNQYWTPGALSPMSIMGKYYMYYGTDYVSPRELGRLNAERLKKELILDNLGICRFHRAWAEDIMPDVIDKLYGLKKEFLDTIAMTASRINSRNSSVFWESERNMDYVYTFLKRKKEIDKVENDDLNHWIEYFEKDKKQASLDFWYDVHKGIQETLSEYLLLNVD
jgi:glyceraldehyde-3-phosphate dehydrogenase (ferredoxin)